MMKKILPFIASIICLTGAAPGAWADPPGRVGRLSYSEGTVSIRYPGQDDWDYATVNTPVTSGEALWTEDNARSEIQVGPAEIRMDNATELDVTELDDNAVVLNVPQGVVNVHMHETIPGGFVVATPAGPVTLSQAGTYRIDSGEDDDEMTPSTPVLISVLEGQAQIRAAGGVPVTVMAGEELSLQGSPPVMAMNEVEPTPFDDWALARDQRARAPVAAAYVSPEVTGYQDLDDNGDWQQTPDYGALWYPRNVAADWEPYRNGHWDYIEPWGWTWIDDAPWGFAPFHYGRWVHDHNNRWGWWPGAVHERAVYAPALVAFIGGSGWNITVAQGPAIGWVPLAPHEVFEPYYNASREYRHRLNRRYANEADINIVTINNNYTINHYHNGSAAVVVPAGRFRPHARVHDAAVTPDAAQLSQARTGQSVPAWQGGHDGHGNRTEHERAGVAGTIAGSSTAASNAGVNAVANNDGNNARSHEHRGPAPRPQHENNVPVTAVTQTPVVTTAIATPAATPLARTTTTGAPGPHRKAAVDGFNGRSPDSARAENLNRVPERNNNVSAAPARLPDTNAVIGSENTTAAETQHAPAPHHMHRQATATAAPPAVSAGMTASPSETSSRPAVSPAVSAAHENVAAPVRQRQERDNQANRATARQQMPSSDRSLAHPVQSTRLTATQQGWHRTPRENQPVQAANPAVIPANGQQDQVNNGHHHH